MTATTTAETFYTVSAGGFSATADAIAFNERTEEIYFVSLIGPQTAVKAIWAALLDRNPKPVHIHRQSDEDGENVRYTRLAIPSDTIGTWTHKISKLPVSRAYHAMVYTRLAEYGGDRNKFVILSASHEENLAQLHLRFLDQRSNLPIHRSWGDWLWDRGRNLDEIVPLHGHNIRAYACEFDEDRLAIDISDAIREGRLQVTDD